MTLKLTNLSELQAILSDNEKTNEGVLHFHSRFNISRLMHTIDAVKV